MMIPEIDLAERILLKYWKKDFHKGEITFDEYTSKVWHLAKGKETVPEQENSHLVCKCNGTGTVKHENGKCLVPCFDCDAYSNSYPGYISAYNVSPKNVVPEQEKPPLVLEDEWNSETGKYQKTCKMCSETFEGRKNQLYCRKECRSAFNNEKAANRKTFVPEQEHSPLVWPKEPCTNPKCNQLGFVKKGKKLEPCTYCTRYEVFQNILYKAVLIGTFKKMYSRNKSIS